MEIGCASSSPAADGSDCALDGSVNLVVLGAGSALRLSGGLTLTSEGHAVESVQESFLRCSQGSVELASVRVHRYKLRNPNAYSIEAASVSITDTSFSECTTEQAGNLIVITGVSGAAELRGVTFESIAAHYTLVHASSSAILQNEGSLTLADLTCTGCTSETRDLVRLTSFAEVTLEGVRVSGSASRRESVVEVSFLPAGGARRLTVDGLELSSTDSELQAVAVLGAADASVRGLHYAGGSAGGVLHLESPELAADLYNLTLSSGSSSKRPALDLRLTAGSSASSVTSELLRVDDWTTEDSYAVLSIESSGGSGAGGGLARVTATDSEIAGSSTQTSFVQVLNADTTVDGLKVSDSTSGAMAVAVSGAEAVSLTGITTIGLTVGIGSVVNVVGFTTAEVRSGPPAPGVDTPPCARAQASERD